MNSEIKVVQPSGILNSSLASQLCGEIDEVVKAGNRLVLIDLQAITFIDSSGLGGLVSAFKSARAVGGKVVLCSVCEQARMLIEITGMDQVFEIFPDQTAFNQSLVQAV